MAVIKEDPNIASGRHWYIYNTFGSFYKGLLNWFGNFFYDRFQYRVIATYEKSVELFNKRLQYNKEVNNQIFPAITLDPSFDFDYADGIGQTLWQKPYIAPNMVPYLWEEIEGLKDQEVRFTVIFTRFRGTVEITFWLNSVYELLDTRMELLLFSGGLNRYLRPEVFQSFLVIPNEIIEYEIDGKKIDWTNTNLILKLLKEPNKYKYVLPITLDPIFKFTAISDNSVKYGNDSLTEYKLSASIDYEINIPTYSVLQDDKTAKLVFNLYSDIAYSKYGTKTYYDEETQEYKPQDKTSYVPKLGLKNKDKFDQKSDILKATDYSYYKFTRQDVEEYESIGEQDYEGIMLPNPYFDIMKDGDEIKCISYVGELKYEEQWKYENDKRDILINIKPIEDELVEFHFYQRS